MDLTNENGVTGKYEPLQFHFHSPSEHTVEGKLYPAELHIVHLGCKDSRKLGCGEVAVLGIFLDTMHPDEDNRFLDEVFGAFETRNKDDKDKETINVQALIDTLDTDGYWSYHGSFTTPPCTEGVQ